MELLLTHGACLNARTSDHLTPLHLACQYNHKDVRNSGRRREGGRLRGKGQRGKGREGEGRGGSVRKLGGWIVMRGSSDLNASYSY